MRSLTSGRWRWIALATIVATIAGAGGAYAAYPQDSVGVYTGCLNIAGDGNGTINALAPGLNPLRACGKNQILVHLSGGTITEIKAGTGLTGGGSNGSVTLNLASSYQLPQTCTNGSIIKWNGSVWTCASEQTYTNGTGLDLSGNTFSINPNYQLPQSCTAGQIAKSGGQSTAWACGDQNTYSGNDFALSNQSCNSGQFVNAINSTGHTQCGNDQTYNGHDFATSGQACSQGDYVQGIDSNGAVICTTDSPTGLHSVYDTYKTLDVSTFALPNTVGLIVHCNSGDVATGGGVDAIGVGGSVFQSRPVGLTDQNEAVDGWEGKFNVESFFGGPDHFVTTYVVCAKTG